MEEHYLLTEGVTSVVTEQQHDGEGVPRGLGHVALLDWDDHMTLQEAEEAVREAEGTGPTFILRSSEGNLHGWDVTVRRFSETADLLDRLQDDTGHLRVGKDRGWWRLRYGPKISTTGTDPEEYKPAPRPVGFVEPRDRPDSLRVSGPHLELLRAAGFGLGADVVEGDPETEVVGDLAQVVGYVTMTDVEKAVRRRVVD